MSNATNTKKPRETKATLRAECETLSAKVVVVLNERHPDLKLSGDDHVEAFSAHTSFCHAEKKGELLRARNALAAFVTRMGL